MSQFALPDSITVSNASQTLQAGLAALQGGTQEFDCAPLQQLDSAAVATLLAWLRAARTQGRQLTFLNLPPNLLALIQMYGVESLILPQVRH